MISRRSGLSLSGEKALQNGYGTEEICFFCALEKEYTELRFVFGAKFAFRPPRTIIIGPSEPFWQLLTLHEISHALLKHSSFKMDVERLKMEKAAWEKARELAILYNVGVDDDLIQGELDTYRDWLHKKSRCPQCGLTRFQTPDARYHCPLCDSLTSIKAQ